MTKAPLLLALALAALPLISCKTRGGEDGASGLTADEGYDPAAYTGHSDYRLVFVRRPGAVFAPSDDLLTPGPAARLMAQVGDALRTAALHSLVPAIGYVSGQRTGTENDLMTSLMGMARHAGVVLREEIQPILANDGGQFPLVAEAMVVPWTKAEAELFYDEEKISMNAGLANVIGVSAADEAFPKRLTEAIVTLQKKLYKASPDPWYLLSARQFLFIMPGKSRLTLRVLVGLKPLTQPFVKEDDKVRFKQVVVPDLAERGIVVSATFDVDLEPGGADPTLTLEFGDFLGYALGNYTVVESTQAQKAPRMEGQVSKTGAGWIALNFSFRKLAFNLRTAQVASIETLLSPGLRLGGANWVVGGLRVQSVDQSFQTEINNTIDGQIQGALGQANDKILDGMMTKETMEQAFRILFAREQGGGA